jgi:hypothetical protein
MGLAISASPAARYAGILAAVIYIVTIGVATFIPAILVLETGSTCSALSFISRFTRRAVVYRVRHHRRGGRFYDHHRRASHHMVWPVLRQDTVRGRRARVPARAIPLGWAIAGGVLSAYALISKILPLLLIAYAAMTPYLLRLGGDDEPVSFVHFYGMDWDLVVAGLRTRSLWLQ